MGRLALLSLAGRSVWAAALCVLLELPRDLVSAELGVPEKTLAWRLGTYVGSGQRQERHWSALQLVALARLEEAVLGTRRIRDAWAWALDGDAEDPRPTLAEGDLARLVGATGEALGEAGQALADGRVSDDEARGLLPRLNALRQALDEAERSLRDRIGGEHAR